jgi:hypothetical protein
LLIGLRRTSDLVISGLLDVASVDNLEQVLSVESLHELHEHIGIRNDLRFRVSPGKASVIKKDAELHHIVMLIVSSWPQLLDNCGIQVLSRTRTACHAVADVAVVKKYIITVNQHQSELIASASTQELVPFSCDLISLSFCHISFSCYLISFSCYRVSFTCYHISFSCQKRVLCSEILNDLQVLSKNRRARFRVVIV